jgi:hypothetical protein
MEARSPHRVAGLQAVLCNGELKLELRIATLITARHKLLLMLEANFLEAKQSEEP